MSDLSDRIRTIHGETEQSWELTTSLPTEDDQGIILLQIAEGTHQDTVREIHRLIESACEGILGE